MLQPKAMTAPVDLTKHPGKQQHQRRNGAQDRCPERDEWAVDPTKLKATNPWQQGGAEYLGGV